MTVAEIFWTEQNRVFITGFVQCLNDRGIRVEVDFFESDDGTPCLAIVTPAGECLLHAFRKDGVTTLLDGEGEFLRSGENLEELLYGVRLT